MRWLERMGVIMTLPPMSGYLPTQITPRRANSTAHGRSYSGGSGDADLTHQRGALRRLAEYSCGQICRRLRGCTVIQP
jgi:hypothetical protein